MSDELSIAEQLVKANKITEDEKWTWQVADTEWDDPTNTADDATTEKVQKLVDEVKESKTPPELVGNSDVDTVEFPDTKPLGPKTDGMPVVNLTSGDKGSSVQVSTDALNKFSANVQILEKMVKEQYDAVDGVDIKPGLFGAGVFVSDSIQVGLKNDTMRFLSSVLTTLKYVQADIKTLITDYDTTEERHSMTAEKLNDLFYDAFGEIGNYDAYGNFTTDKIGGDSGSGGGNNGNGNGNNGNGDNA